MKPAIKTHLMVSVLVAVPLLAAQVIFVLKGPFVISLIPAGVLLGFLGGRLLYAIVELRNAKRSAAVEREVTELQAELIRMQQKRIVGLTQLVILMQHADPSRRN